MRETDEDVHPAALARERRKNIQFYAGLVIALAGLVAVFAFREVYLGFGVAMIGAGVVPVDKVAELIRRP